METMRWMPAYVGLGSNLDDPVGNVERGFAALATLPSTQLVAQSPRYRSLPVGPQDQPSFINAVAGLITQLDAASLLSGVKALELELGRTLPIVRWGPRIIDFDVLVYADLRLSTPTITIPHASLPERNWVLRPLADIAPDLDIPGVGRARELADRIGSFGLDQL